MPASAATVANELVLTRLINVPRDKLFRCWTEPALIIQWFTPPPWKTIAAEVDPRPGGASLITMQGPDGTQMPNRGVYLEFVKNERLVFTDAYTSARVRHWSAEDCAAHEEMGFHEGWGIATTQLAALAATL